MDLGIAGRTALITAASSGIGRACAEVLSAEGCNVSICARGSERLERTGREIKRIAEGGVLAIPADVTSPADLEVLASATIERFGGIDILIAIGGSPQRGGFDSVTDEDFIGAFEMTVLATVRLVRLVTPHMRVRKWGRIVTVQARSVREPIPDLVTSNAVRPGVAGFIKYMSRQLAPDGILLNTIIPGRILTNRLQGGVGVSQMSEEDYHKARLSDLPVGRYGAAAEIANVAAFLVSERASYVTGAAIPVDGGLIRSI